MSNIDKEAFAIFICELRKEKGLTQKELAQKLNVTDKAVSKWERAQSMPDIYLLLPLSEIFDISVTELLKCERVPKDSTMSINQVELLLKKTIASANKAGFIKKVTEVKENPDKTKKHLFITNFVSIIFVVLLYGFTYYVSSNLDVFPVTLIGPISNTLALIGILANIALLIFTLVLAYKKTLYYLFSLPQFCVAIAFLVNYRIFASSVSDFSVFYNQLLVQTITYSIFAVLSIIFLLCAFTRFYQAKEIY